MIRAENASELVGVDAVDYFILICMHKSSLVFDIVEGGVGLQGKCLAYVAPNKNDSIKEGDNDEHEAERE
ncbi:hypothetical protein [Selenomonas ruminantium]|uniref:Uncharacterized protein n=1 Tax=Selenomonas ruminantium TaxID=971 RepID=A0A1H3XGQ1_SELRU|nr:hypothetical protein [Selenomonas ruminantium]SDZ98390.1 hypothetical protein SAMN05660648_01496 [Selenomonas ruminantium]